MHELSITQSILDITLKYALANQAKRVTDIYLEIGQLSSIIDESVQFYWDIISDDTISKGAKLHFERIAALLECNDCKFSYLIDSEIISCPKCKSIRIMIIRGQEFQINSIEIEN